MASKEEATLTIKIKDKASGFLKKIVEATKRLAKTTAKAGATLTAIYAATTAAIVTFGKNGVKFKTVEDSFRNLAASQGQDSKKMLANMTKLSAGTVSKLELMTQANNALLLGLPVDKFGEVVKLARGAAASLGTSVEFQLKSLVTGLGRNSKLMLDNAGIIVDTARAHQIFADSIGVSVEALSDQQKKQAFISAALKTGRENLEKQGGVVTSTADMWKSFGVTLTNIKDKLSILVIPAFNEVIRTTKPMIDLFSELSNHPFVKQTAIALTKGFTIVNVVLESITKSMNEKLGPVFSAIPLLLAGNFSKAKKVLQTDTRAFNEIAVEQKVILKERLNQVDKDFAALEIIDLKKQNALKAQLAATKAEEERIAAEEKFIGEQELANARFEAETELLNTTEEEKNQILLKSLDTQLKNTKDFQKRKSLLEQQGLALEIQRDLKQEAFKKKNNEERIKNQGDTFRTIATMANSNNSTLALIGKAAALTEIAISGPIAVTKALAAFPPPFNFAAAAAVGAAVSVQAARVAGVPLAEGGIVQATQGGVQATIGEGGRDEAVVPLPDDFDPDEGGGLGGGGVTINTTALVTDESGLRELALLVDRGLTELRRNNESNAFDTDLT